MPNYNDIFQEVINLEKNGHSKDALNIVRAKYIDEFSEYRKRPTLLYYSGWLQKRNNEYQALVPICDNDMNFFMNAVNCIKKKYKGDSVDIILHTPGGDMAATEAIAKYLQSCFKNISCFVPQLAQSAGTTIACSCNDIYMGKQSSLGPVDPQIGQTSCCGLVDEFERIKKEFEKIPSSIVFWQPFLAKYPPALIIKCYKIIELAKETLTNNLRARMFKDKGRSINKKIGTIVKRLAEHKSTKMHNRHIDKDSAKKIGLKIIDLENDQHLQDLLLSIHHACMITFTLTSAIKIIKTNNDGGVILHLNPDQREVLLK